MGAAWIDYVTRWGAKNGSHSSGIVPLCQTGETSGSELGWVGAFSGNMPASSHVKHPLRVLQL